MTVGNVEFLWVLNMLFCFYNLLVMCDASCDLVPFVQFKKRENGGEVLLLETLQALA